jgi:NarL family two-component system response regulator LiaR
MIRVLVADDHPIVRQGLRALLEGVGDIEVVAEASDGVEAVRKAKSFIPDVILLDLMMPHMTGFEAIPEIRREVPHSRILVLTNYADDDKVFDAIKAGALGYVLKESASTELVQAIYRLYQDQPLLNAAIARKLIRELNRPTVSTPPDEPLTDREAEILILIARGLTPQDIGDKLLMNEQSVFAQINSIIRKFHYLLGDL